MSGFSDLRATAAYYPAFPFASMNFAVNGGISGFVPAYSGATVPDSHRIPLAAMGLL